MNKLFSLFVATSTAAAVCRGGETQPNVIILLTDDQETLPSSNTAKKMTQ